MKNRTRKITLGALLAALVGVVLMINRQLGGLFDIYLIWVIPLPLVLYAAEYGFRDALVVCAAVIFLSFVLSTPVTMVYTAFSVLIGAVYGYGLNSGKSATWLLGAAILGTFASEITTTYIFADFFGYPVSTQIEEIRAMLAQMQVELPGGWNLLYLLLAFVVITAIMEGVMIHLLTALIMKRLKKSFPQYAASQDARMPKWLAGLSILVIAAYFISAQINPESAWTEGLLIASLPLFLIGLFFGYTVVIVWLKMRVNPRMIALFVVLLLLGAFATFPFMAGIGYADAFVDFKKAMRTGRKK
ncbi:MAG: DUF2232 domain-containing protein [Erysipelotrichales bacterium]|nr:DUF2232 domain-containing protein [Erysipelotrichales bacterium]